MAAVDTSKVSEAHPMQGGDGPNSYAKNSTVQRGFIDGAKEPLNEAVAEHLDIEIFSPSKAFCIADLGCSTGPNTFLAVQNILEAVETKYKSQGLNSPKFQVFFNDHTSNDFNMLFKSLPVNKRYYAAGVPGSFYGRLFPNASIHFFHSSYAIHWLSRVPKQVLDKHGPAWNEGHIHYLNSTDEVFGAYQAQYVEDMMCFLRARAQEIVNKGLLVLNFPGHPDSIDHSQCMLNATFQLLGSCLMDLAMKGIVSKEKLDSFNIPVYSMTPQELAAVVERNGCFTIETMRGFLPSIPPESNTTLLSQLMSSHMRGGMEETLKEQFGEEILDELFDLYCTKIEENASTFLLDVPVGFLIVLRRKVD